MQNSLVSARIRGAAEGSAEVTVRKAPPLTGAQVKFLEWFEATAEGRRLSSWGTFASAFMPG